MGISLLALLLSLSSTVFIPAATAVEFPWMDSSLPIPERVDLLVAAMTPQEKVSQLLSTHLYLEDTPAFLRKYGSMGFGVLLPCPRLRSPDLPPPTAAACMRWRAALQEHFITRSRLRIPPSFREELLHSAGVPGATVFPMPAGLGASWNQSLVAAVYGVIGREARAAGVDYGFGPVLQVATAALWGRTQEAFGGDPVIVSLLAAAATRGLQGEPLKSSGGFNKSAGVLCQAKHYAAYGHMAHDTLPVDISETTLREVYLRPWRDWVREAGGQAVMVAHTPLNGLPLAASHHYLTTVLREDLAGSSRPLTLASDGGDVSHLFSTWRVARTLGEAGALAMAAGLDQELQTDWTGFAFEAAAALHLLPAPDLDRAARNVLRLKFLSGLFDDAAGPPSPDPETVAEAFQWPDARQLSYEAAVQSAVLLVNKQVGGLPLRAAYRFGSVLLLGPNAGCVDGFGSGGRYKAEGGRSLCPARGAAMGGYHAPTSEEEIVTLEDAAREYYQHSRLPAALVAASCRVTFLPGASVCSPPEADVGLIEDAVAAVESQIHDVIVLGLGDNSDADSRDCEQCGEGRDRTSLDLSGGQLPLLSAVLEAVSSIKAVTGRTVPVVVVLLHGRPVTFNGEVMSFPGNASNALLRHPALTALVAAWRPGPLGGRALWGLLTGQEQFSGKLTQPWPRNVGQMRSAACPWFQYPLREGGVGDSYAFREPQSALFPFSAGIIPGTRFVFSRLRAHVCGGESTGADVVVTASGVIDLRVVVTNEGTDGGSALVAVYCSPPVVPLVLRYARRLVTFSRVFVAAGGSAEVVMQVHVQRDLACYDPELKAEVVDIGEYGLHVGDCCVTGVLPEADAQCQEGGQASTVVNVAR